MSKIKLTTSGLPIGKRVNSRKVDLDHAQTIIEYTQRGYMITASSEATPWWTISFLEGSKGRLFSNSPDWVTDETRNVMVRPNYGSDDGRLYDDQPEWQQQLVKLCRTASGNTVDWH